MPLLIHGEQPHVIGHDPDAPGAFGELMLVSEVLARVVPDGVPNDAVALVDAFAVGEFYVRCSGISPGDLPLVIGAGAIGLSTVAALAARGVAPIIIADYNESRLDYAKKFGAEVVVNPAERSPYDTWRELARDKGVTTPQVIFECVGAQGLMGSIVDSCEFLARIYAAGGWYGNDTVSVTTATHKGATIQFGGGPHPQDWYGTLQAVADGRVDPLPSIGKVIGLDEVPAAIEAVRKAQGPPRIVVHHE
jgi:threonine dehydrogenase-like Zn-dependent dehydrogenase